MVMNRRRQTVQSATWRCSFAELTVFFRRKGEPLAELARVDHEIRLPAAPAVGRTDVDIQRGEVERLNSAQHFLIDAICRDLCATCE